MVWACPRIRERITGSKALATARVCRDSFCFACVEYRRARTMGGVDWATVFPVSGSTSPSSRCGSGFSATLLVYRTPQTGGSAVGHRPGAAIPRSERRRCRRQRIRHGRNAPHPTGGEEPRSAGVSCAPAVGTSRTIGSPLTLVGAERSGRRQQIRKRESRVDH